LKVFGCGLGERCNRARAVDADLAGEISASTAAATRAIVLTTSGGAERQGTAGGERNQFSHGFHSRLRPA